MATLPTVNMIFGLPAYHMVVVNLILFAALALSAVIFKIKPAILIILVSILPIVSIFRRGDYNTGLYQNSAFAMGFYNSLSDGNMIPRWAERSDTLYGYPEYIFFYHLPFYFTAFFHYIGFDFANSVKLVLALAYLTAGITMYKWAREEFPPWTAFLVSVMYQFAPYRLIDLHFRLEMGEVVCFALAPLAFLAIKKRKVILGALSIAGLILSHPALSTAFEYLLGAYWIYLNWGKKFGEWIRSFYPIILGVMLSAYYWFPVLWEMKWVHINAWKTGELSPEVIFLNFRQLLYSPWRWGLLFQGNGGELAMILGYVQWVIVIAAIMIMFKTRKINFWTVAILPVLVLFFNFSKPLWHIIPLIKNFQYSYRLLGAAAFITAMMTGYLISKIKYSRARIMLIFIIAGAAILTTILNWGNREDNPAIMTDVQIYQMLPYGQQKFLSGFGQAIPIWADVNNLWASPNSNKPAEISEGKAVISQIFRNSTKHEYTINAETSVRIKENTYYYPGWILTVDGNKKTIEYQDKDYPGVMEFNLSPGEHLVSLEFTNTWDRTLALIISGLTGTYIIVIMFINVNNRK